MIKTTVTEPVAVSKVFPAQHCHFILKIANRGAAFKIGSLEAVAAPWFKDPVQEKAIQNVTILGSKEENEVAGFFTVAFLLFLAPAGALTLKD